MKERAISTPAMAVLSQAHVLNRIGHCVVTLHSGQLERPLYQEVDYVLRAIGGKWDRKAAGHRFEEPTEDVENMLEGCIQTGIATPLRPGSFFPTPPALGEKMVALAQIEKNMTILEPSAGDGQLAVVISRMKPEGCKLYCLEIDQKLFMKLTYLYQNDGIAGVACTDFLETDIAYDRIIMNPPFHKLADVDHITHAWKCLKPNGRLVAIASAGISFRMEKKAQDFRELLRKAGSYEALPQNTFKPSGTMVNTVVIVLQK